MPCKKPLNLVNIFHWKGCGEIIGKSQACGGKSMSVWVITSWVGGVQSASFTSLVTSGCIATLMSLSPSPGLSSLLTAAKFNYILRRWTHVYVIFNCPSLLPLMHSNWIIVSVILPKSNWDLGKEKKKKKHPQREPHGWPGAKWIHLCTNRWIHHLSLFRVCFNYLWLFFWTEIKPSGSQWPHF